ncbi:MAG: CDP-alcohol phosphatidyltransferase family protein [Kiritimatiellae bacterium]|nr:CDP-alcohol phosphatidyltransferase family protein [Kiritimatiellia bacterium]
MIRPPDIFSLTRIACCPLLLVCAVTGRPRAFMGLAVFALLTDAVDGFLARRLKVASPRGAELDSWSDMSLVVTLTLGAAWLWPDILREEAVYMTISLLSFLLPTIYGVVKYGHTTSYHTWGAKICYLLLALALILRFLRIAVWPFRAVVPLVVLEALQEIAMTTMLPRWHPNIPTIWHAMRIRRKLLSAGTQQGEVGG